MPKTEWLASANKHARKGLSVFRAKIPLPRQGMKKNQGTITLKTPNIRPPKKPIGKSNKKYASIQKTKL